MSATDELRKLLDERGVEWETDGSGFRVMWGQPVSIDQMQFKAVDNALPNGGLNISICGFSPEQAIAATLGAGTCRVIKSELDGQMWVYRHEFSCACGQRNMFTSCSTPPRYCPNCGRKVEG